MVKVNVIPYLLPFVALAISPSSATFGLLSGLCSCVLNDVGAICGLGAFAGVGGGASIGASVGVGLPGASIGGSSGYGGGGYGPSGGSGGYGGGSDGYGGSSGYDDESDDNGDSGYDSGDSTTTTSGGSGYDSGDSGYDSGNSGYSSTTSSSGGSSGTDTYSGSPSGSSSTTKTSTSSGSSSNGGSWTKTTTTTVMSHTEVTHNFLQNINVQVGGKKICHGKNFSKLSDGSYHCPCSGGYVLKCSPPANYGSGKDVTLSSFTAKQFDFELHKGTKVTKIQVGSPTQTKHRGGTKLSYSKQFEC